MATTAHAEKVLAKAAGIKVEDLGRERTQRYATINDSVVSFYDQNGEAICFYVRPSRMQDDITTDFSAGIYVPNIARAVRLARV